MEFLPASVNVHVLRTHSDVLMSSAECPAEARQGFQRCSKTLLLHMQRRAHLRFKDNSVNAYEEAASGHAVHL